MKPLDIEFLPAAPLRRRPAFWVLVLMLTVAVVLALDTARLAWRLAELERAAAPVPLSSPPPVPSVAPAPAPPGAREFAALARLDHGAVLRSIESARVPGVRVLALEVNATDETARLDIELRDQADVMRYLSEINAGMPEAQRWMLVRAQANPENAPASASLRLHLWTLDPSSQRDR